MYGLQSSLGGALQDSSVLVSGLLCLCCAKYCGTHVAHVVGSVCMTMCASKCDCVCMTMCASKCDCVCDYVSK